MSADIRQNLDNLKQRIRKACENCGRNPEEITLVAVSKTKPDKDILQALKAGQVHFGENRAKELEDKMKSIREGNIKWHFIGNLQTNKIKYMAHGVDWIQSIHKKKALKEVEKRAAAENRTINVLIQVNISDEDQKSGCLPDDLGKILKYGRDLKFTKIKGLMGMATFTGDEDVIRREFSNLRNLRSEHEHLNDGAVQLEQLSMGMTNDLEIAIEQGSTMVRVGTAIFGERNYE